jgi:hypothetical protein
MSSFQHALKRRSELKENQGKWSDQELEMGTVLASHSPGALDITAELI